MKDKTNAIKHKKQVKGTSQRIAKREIEHDDA